MSDLEPEKFEFDLSKELFDRVLRIEDLEINGDAGWIFSHDVVELCTAVKGAALCKLLALGAEKVIYLDPDIALFDDLKIVLDLLETNAIVLTPHLLGPETTYEGIEDNEIGCLKHGVYNLGFIGVANCDEGVSFAHWWRDRLFNWCFDDVPNGLFTDQRWCDLIPCFFPKVHILRDAGFNVACWNLGNRPITFREDGEIWAGATQLKFFHFTKVNTVGELVLERYAGGQTEVFELLHWYRRKLKASVAENLPAGWWAFGAYDDGEPIVAKHRQLYRASEGLRSRFPNPFKVGVGSFREWIEGEKCAAS